MEQRDRGYSLSSRLNAKNGFIVGSAGGLLIAGISLLVEPELNQMPLEDILVGSALGVSSITFAMSATGYINQKVIEPVRHYLNKRF